MVQPLETHSKADPLITGKTGLKAGKIPDIGGLRCSQEFGFKVEINEQDLVRVLVEDWDKAKYQPS